MRRMVKGQRLVSLGILAGVLLGANSVLAQELSEELATVRRALEKYQDPVVAIHDGYLSTLGCIGFTSGAGPDRVPSYAPGGMGVHFVNRSLIGPVPDPKRPPILLYEPVGDELRLVGAEWFIPLATGVKERPSLFGQPFDGPMEGHHPLQPIELHHYDLHVWLFKPNPTGMFKPVNPDVKCPKTGYSFMEQPPKLVPHPKP